MKDKPLATMHAPLTVLPAPFPRSSFEKAKSAMTVFNRLADKVARDDKYLQDTLRSAAEYDDFTVSVLAPSHSCIVSTIARCMGNYYLILNHVAGLSLLRLL